MTEQPGQPRGPRTGVYPGTFDPIHNGHLDIIRRTTLFDVAEDEPGGGHTSGRCGRTKRTREENPEDTHSAAAVRTNLAVATQTNPRAGTAAGLSRAAASGELDHD